MSRRRRKRQKTGVRVLTANQSFELRHGPPGAGGRPESAGTRSAFRSDEDRRAAFTEYRHVLSRRSWAWRRYDPEGASE